ncbi:MAG: hypothetical protein A2W00_11330 [Candidatus Eisenbacteria bacterium RBG_16_71_46]|nr:MAG: hypothetical protein A2W00_11330 [Candidatus Eisenbacteria bacterium RBG_16_71_46]
MLAGAVLLAGGCGRERARSGAPAPPRVDVLADTGRAIRLKGPAPPDSTLAEPFARVWMARVSPARPATPEPPLPTPVPAAPPALPAPPPALEVDAGLQPPILRWSAPLVPPRATRAGRAAVSVELDVLVDERGSVADVRWAGGSAEPVGVAAAVACARSMRFYPALRGGRPVAVWRRQRFAFGGGSG